MWRPSEDIRKLSDEIFFSGWHFENILLNFIQMNLTRRWWPAMVQDDDPPRPPPSCVVSYLVGNNERRDHGKVASQRNIVENYALIKGIAFNTPSSFIKCATMCMQFPFVLKSSHHRPSHLLPSVCTCASTTAGVRGKDTNGANCHSTHGSSHFSKTASISTATNPWRWWRWCCLPA